MPGAGLMEAPDVDEATSFLIHPGVRVYVNGEQRSLFDRYSDYIYLLAFLGSGLGSVTAGLFGMMSGRRDDPSSRINNIQSVLDGVRDAKSAEELDHLQHQSEEIFRNVLAHGIRDELSASAIASFDMAMTELRSRIAARRQALAAG